MTAPAQLPCPLREQARRRPDATAYSCGEDSLTFADFDAAVESTRQQLQAQGLHAGDLLLARAGNGLPLLRLIWACLRAGVLICPLNPRLPPQQCDALARRLGARALWDDGGTLTLAEVARLTFSDAWTPHRIPPGTLNTLWLDGMRLANLTLTSGSLGEPKAVAHRLGAHVASARGSAQRLPLGEEGGWLLSLPLFHVGGFAIVVRCLLAGARLVLPAAGESLSECLRWHAVSHLSLVPTQLWRLLQQPQFALAETRLRHLLLGGAPIPAALISACQAQGLTPWVSYGLSEMASQVCTAPASTGDAGVGTPLPERALRLEHGEIQVRGATLFAGYYAAGGTLTRPLTADGWFATGDLGRYLPDGRLEVLGRRDNRFICGGENIQPEQIEQQLAQHPAVRQVIVVPRDDAEWGQQPVAIVDSTLSEAELPQLATWLRPRLPGYLIPRHWLGWPAQEQSALKPGRRPLAAYAASRLDPTQAESKPTMPTD